MGSFNIIHKLTGIVHFEIKNFRWDDVPRALKEKLSYEALPERKIALRYST